jgi:peroxiredoxin Q/BCP
MLTAGVTAPELDSVVDQDGNPVRLADVRGRWVLLWWSALADTPGWPILGKGLRDQAQEFEALGCEILGISFDAPEANRAFREKFDFPFRLLSDFSEQVGVAYETRAPGTDKVNFAKRYSYLIDPEGVIAKSYEVADVNVHAETVLRELQARWVTDGDPYAVVTVNPHFFGLGDTWRHRGRTKRG